MPPLVWTQSNPIRAGLPSCRFTFAERAQLLKIIGKFRLACHNPTQRLLAPLYHPCPRNYRPTTYPNGCGYTLPTFSSCHLHTPKSPALDRAAHCTLHLNASLPQPLYHDVAPNSPAPPYSASCAESPPIHDSTQHWTGTATISPPSPASTRVAGMTSRLASPLRRIPMSSGERPVSNRPRQLHSTRFERAHRMAGSRPLSSGAIAPKYPPIAAAPYLPPHPTILHSQNV